MHPKAQFPRSQAAFYVALGNNIKAKREELDMSRAQFLRRTGCTPSESMRIERGEVAVGAFKAAVIAQALGCTLDTLLPAQPLLAEEANPVGVAPAPDEAHTADPEDAPPEATPPASPAATTA